MTSAALFDWVSHLPIRAVGPLAPVSPGSIRIGSAALLSQTRPLARVPAWAIAAYLLVAASMAVTVFLRFLRQGRSEKPRPGQGIARAMLLLPILAISIVWPITLPIVLLILMRQRK